MAQVICYGCNEEINEKNESAEHIINNSIGGHLKSKKLICKTCNNKFGNTIDAELEQQIGMFTGLLGITKDRETNSHDYRLTTADGEVTRVGKKMKPLNKLKFKLPDREVLLFATDENYEKLKNRKQKELDQHFKTEFKETIEPPDKKIYYIGNKLTDEIGHIAFGGKPYFQSIAKMCLNYYLFKGHNIKYCKEIIQFINGEDKAGIVDYFYPSNQSIHLLGEKEITHLIQIIGDSKNKVLFAYIELFSMQNLIVKFEMNYGGPEILDTYCYSPIDGQEIEKPIRVRLTKSHLQDLNIISDSGIHRHTEKYNRMLKIIESRQLED